MDVIASEPLSLRTQANKNAGENPPLYMVMLLIALAKWEIKRWKLQVLFDV